MTKRTESGNAAGRQGARVFEYDLVRIVACLMIVTMHAPMPSSEAHSVLLAGISYVTTPGIGLFFMLSGALLLPVQDTTAVFLRKRLGRIVFPLLVWTVADMAISWWNGAGNTAAGLWRAVLSAPFSVQGSPVLWFLYALIGIYLLAPLISRGLEACSRAELRFYLLLWGVSLCLPILGQWLVVARGEASALYYFSGYIGYFVLGYYCRRYGTPFPFTVAVFLALLAVAAPALFRIAGWQVDLYGQFWYLSVPVVVMTIGWWGVMEKAGQWAAPLLARATRKAFARVSDLTFGIYLVHVYVLRNFLWKSSWVGSIAPESLRTFVLVVLGTIFSALFCYILSLLPGAQYVIGYRKKTIR